MEFPHLFTPSEVSVLTAAGLGSVTFLFFNRKPGWLQAFGTVFVGMVTAYYATPQIAAWRGWSMGTYGFVGFSIGLLGMLVLGGFINLAQSFHDDPRGTAQWLWGFWRGGQSNGGGKP